MCIEYNIRAARSFFYSLRNLHNLFPFVLVKDEQYSTGCRTTIRGIPRLNMHYIIRDPHELVRSLLTVYRKEHCKHPNIYHAYKLGTKKANAG